MTPPFYLVGEESPLPAAPASPGLPDTPSPRSSAPKTREMRRHKALLWTEQPILHIFM